MYERSVRHHHTENIHNLSDRLRDKRHRSALCPKDNRSCWTCEFHLGNPQHQNSEIALSSATLSSQMPFARIWTVSPLAGSIPDSGVVSQKTEQPSWRGYRCQLGRAGWLLQSTWFRPGKMNTWKLDKKEVQIHLRKGERMEIAPQAQQVLGFYNYIRIYCTMYNYCILYI